MSAARKPKIKDQLWPPDVASPLGVFAILDGARDERVFPEVSQSNQDHACLYAGKLPRELKETAPYLVKLDPEARFTDTLIDDAWGKSWGVYALSTASLEELRRHFRKFLKVQDEKGKTLIFRYYDPRVLRVYLPTCNALELKALFGPVSVYVVEAEDPGTLIRYHRQEDKLETTEVSLA